VRQLALQSDVLVENFKVGGLAAYGLDYASLKALNPRLIYCSITGFGQSGPYAERAGYDLMIQAMSGMMSITGRADGVPGGGPQRVGVALTDLFTGTFAATAILAALEVRNRTGQGQHIDMALLDVGMAILANQASGLSQYRQGAAAPGQQPPQPGALPGLPDAGRRDAAGDRQRRPVQPLLPGRGQAGVERRTRASRAWPARVHREALVALMEEVTRTRTTAQWIALLEDKAVPCGPINHIGQAFADPQVQARQLVVEQPRAPHLVAQDGIAAVRGVASPMRLVDTPPVLRRPPPALGEHTAEVLAELGLEPAAIAALRAAGTV
jgi:crotonobetainyl-CoA:carnitine CoA-transferase CaiB-like acyl-CoA transferase